MQITVSVVEGSPTARESIMAILQCAPDLRYLGAFASGSEALRRMAGKKPDVMLVGGLPDMSRTECVTSLKTHTPKTQVLMLSEHEDGGQMLEWLSAGATGCVTKKASPQQLLQAIEQIHAGGSPMPMAVTCYLVNRIKQTPSPSFKLEVLTERELEVLILLADGCRGREIGERLGIGVGTVHGYLHKVYLKLGVKTRTHAVLKFLHANSRKPATKSRRK